MDTFFRLEVYGKVRISLAEVYERVERTLSLHPKGQKAHFMDVKTPKASWLIDLIINKSSEFTAVKGDAEILKLIM